MSDQPIPAGPSSRLKWLHRIGYVTTALVLAEILFAGFIFGSEWLRVRAFERERIEMTRTRDGPIHADGHVNRLAVRLLSGLPALKSLGDDGFRFVAMPSFNYTNYAVALYLPRNGEQATGVLILYDVRADPAETKRRAFIMPKADYARLMAAIDTLTDGWAGAIDLCTDGTPLGFERVRGSRITSGIGNCSDHYDQLGSLVFEALRKIVPEDMPDSENWHWREPAGEAPSNAVTMPKP
ncbi:hypothetical protein P1X14_10985 [Sphingomonas sp. AOB5]|uniref:hypothetical protein n=1 Tax=Sphingomonas sp. AOB5 TaxID=3034017 RepID=UPI0023F6D302|nr:hypothetical protein [Sphingomonas sp. AOB5]MDF7775772.1 hypothetical protein [Sphingomonas sp. AOB5]